MTLRADNLVCHLCGRSISNQDLVALVTHEKTTVAVHLDHHGVSDLISDPVQIVAGSTLREVATEFLEDQSRAS